MIIRKKPNTEQERLKTSLLASWQSAIRHLLSGRVLHKLREGLRGKPAVTALSMALSFQHQINIGWVKYG